MVKSRVFVLLFLSVLLTGCAFAVGGGVMTPSKNAVALYAPIDATWIKLHENDIVASAQQFIQARHPVIDPSFPNIVVNKVHVVEPDQTGVTSNRTEDMVQTDAQLSELFNSLSSKILGQRSNVSVWNTDVTLQFMAPNQANAARISAMIPQFVVCWSSLFVVCPDVETEEVVLRVSVKTSEGKIYTFTTAGDAHLLITSVLNQDSNDPNFNGQTAQNTRALVAAIVGAADQLVKLYKEHGQSDQAAGGHNMALAQGS